MGKHVRIKIARAASADITCFYSNKRNGNKKCGQKRFLHDEKFEFLFLIAAGNIILYKTRKYFLQQL